MIRPRRPTERPRKEPADDSVRGLTSFVISLPAYFSSDSVLYLYLSGIW